MPIRKHRGIDQTTGKLKKGYKYSGKKLQYFDSELGESYVPYVLETSIGLDRMFLSVLSGSFLEEKLENGENINHPITNKKWAQSETPKPEAKKNGIKIYNDLKNHICSLYWIVPKELEEIIKDEKNKIDN